MSTRRWILAMVVIALPLAGLVEMRRRRERFFTVASSHVRNELWARHVAALVPPREMPDFQFGGRTVIWFAGADARKAELLRIAGYHAALARKYLVAARRPWATVAPDPPEPTSPYFRRQP